MFVAELAGVQAVWSWPRSVVEQVPLGLVVPVPGGAAGIVVSECAGGVAQCSQRSDGADRGETPIFDMSLQHNSFLAAGAGDQRGAGEGVQSASIGKPAAVRGAGGGRRLL